MAQKMAKNKKAPKVDGYSAKDEPGTFTISVVASLESNTAKFMGNCVASDLVGELIHRCQESGKSATFCHSFGRIVIDGLKEKHRSILFILTERRGQNHKILKGIDLVYKNDETLEDFYKRIINRRDAVRPIRSGAAGGSRNYVMQSTLVPTAHVQKMMTERGLLWSNIVDIISSISSQSSHQIGDCIKYRKDGVEVVVAPVDFRHERRVITVYKVDADAPPLRDQVAVASTDSARVIDPHALLTRVDRLIELVQDTKAGESLADQNHVLRQLEDIYSHTTDHEDASRPQDGDVVQINRKIVLCLLSIVDIDALLHRETAIEVLASVRAMFAAAYKLCMQSPEKYGFDAVAGSGTGVADVELLLIFQRRLLHLDIFGLDMPGTYHADLTAMVRHLRAVSGSNSPASVRKEVNEVYNFARKVLKSVPRPVLP
jgi:hypothetical protein